MASPLDQCLYGSGLALEHRLDGTVLAVGHPTCHSMRSRLAPTSVAEEHSLHSPMGHHSTPDHGTSQAGVLRNKVTNDVRGGDFVVVSDHFLLDPAQLPGSSCCRASVRASTAARDETNGQSFWFAHSSVWSS